MRLAALLALGGATVLLSACTGGEEDAGPVPPSAPTLTPAPNVHLNVDSRDATRDGGFMMAAGLAGTLRVSPEGCLYAFIPKSPRTGGVVLRTDLVWPRGTSAALDADGKPIVVRYDGVVVVEVGHSLHGLGGGSVTSTGTAHITCQVDAKEPLFFVQGDMPPLPSN